MGRYAVVEDDIVTNVVEWDGVSAWAPKTGEVIFTGEDFVSIGWIKTLEGLRPPPEAFVPRPVREPGPLDILDELIIVLNESGIQVTKESLMERARITLNEKFKDLVDFPQFQ